MSQVIHLESKRSTLGRSVRAHTATIRSRLEACATKGRLSEVLPILKLQVTTGPKGHCTNPERCAFSGCNGSCGFWPPAA